VAVACVVLLCGFERSEKSQSKTTQATDNQPNVMHIFINPYAGLIIFGIHTK